MVHAAAGIRPDAQPALDARVHGLGRARARPTWSRAPRSPRSTGCRCCCCPATSSPPGAAAPVLQELEDPRTYDVSVNDVFRPVSRFFDRINRPEQLPRRCSQRCVCSTDPAETGAVTIALPQDVQAEAYDWPVELFAPRVWHVARPVPEPAALDRARRGHPSARSGRCSSRAVVSSTARPLRRCAALVEATGIPVAETQAGKGSLAWNHPLAVGAIGATGTTAANELAREADVVIGVGTRWSDFTTASRSAFAAPGVRFVNVNVAAFDAAKHSGVAVRGRRARRARAARDGAGRAGRSPGLPSAQPRTGRRLGPDRRARLHAGARPAARPVGSHRRCQRCQRAPAMSWSCAAGSMPGDLHKLWRTRDPKGYHVEYGFSCMGYEIAGGLGVKMAAPDREVFVMVGDGSYLMMAQEIVTAVQEGIKLVVVLVQNHGYRLDRRPFRVPRLATLRHALSLSLRRGRAGAAGRRRRCPPIWPPTPRASAPTSCA